MPQNLAHGTEVCTCAESERGHRMAGAMEGEVFAIDACLMGDAAHILGYIVAFLYQREEAGIGIVWGIDGCREHSEGILVERHGDPCLGLLLTDADGIAIVVGLEVAPGEVLDVAQAEACHGGEAEGAADDIFLLGVGGDRGEAVELVGREVLAMGVGDAEFLHLCESANGVEGDVSLTMGEVEHGVDGLSKEHERELGEVPIVLLDKLWVAIVITHIAVEGGDVFGGDIY